MKILIIRFSSIGDIVLTSPVVRCLAIQKRAEIHYLTKPAYHSILLNSPYLHTIHTYSTSLNEIMPALQKEKFDFVVDLHKNIRSFKVKSQINAPSGSFPKLNLEKWLMVRLKWNKLPDVHIVHRYFETVKKLGVLYDGKGLDYFINSIDQSNGMQKGPSVPYIGFAIGAAHATKKLPVSKIEQICSQLTMNVVLLGGMEESESGESIANQFDHVHNLCGKTTIQESAAIIHNARLLVTNDTGMMHIAAALKNPVISIWGNTIPQFGMYPFYPAENAPDQALFQVDGLKCRPCSKIGYTHCPKGHFNCMQLQNVPQIVEKIESIFNNSDAPLV
jgi:heptosyltransferase-2